MRETSERPFGKVGSDSQGLHPDHVQALWSDPAALHARRRNKTQKANEHGPNYLEFPPIYSNCGHPYESSQHSEASVNGASGNLLSADRFEKEDRKNDALEIVHGSANDFKISINKSIANERPPAVFQPIDQQFQSTSLNADTDQPSLGHPAHIHFRARASNENKMSSEIRQSAPPYAETMNERIDLTSHWQTYDFDSVIPDTTKNGELRFKFKVDRLQQAGIIEIADLSLKEVNKVADADPNDLTTEAENARIDKYRKGDLRITVLDDHGQQLPNARVHIEQTSSQFLFGANLNQFGDKNVPEGQSSLNDQERRKYLEQASALGLNLVTIPIYWSQIENQNDWGHPDYQQIDDAITWAKANGLKVKLHPLVWADCYPCLAGQTKTEAQPLIRKHIEEIIERYGRHVDFLEINEINSADELEHVTKDKRTSVHNGLTDWIEKDGAASVIETIGAWAKECLAKTGSTAQILENEYDIDKKTLAADKQLQADHAQPDGFGVQAHMFEQTWPTLRLYQELNKRGQFGKPVYLTELTVPATDDRTSITDNAAQARQLTAYYRAVFSNPYAACISLWDLTDKNAWKQGSGGVLNAQLNPKPAYHALHDLITKEWHTDETTTTDVSGQVHARVFKGNYKITVDAGLGYKSTQIISADQPHNEHVILMRNASP